MNTRPLVQLNRLLTIFVLVFASGSVHAQGWQSIAPMKVARDELKCVALQNGQILIVGGKNSSGVLSSCELYDPRKNQWSTTGSLNHARYRFSLIALKDGRALAIGGLSDLGVGTTASCELYDPATGTWKNTVALPEPSENVASLILPNGKIFVAGGLNAMTGKYLDFALIYDPMSEMYTTMPNMGIGRTGLLLYHTESGDSLMVCGGEFDGFNGYYLRSTSVYSFKTNQWTLADSSIEPHDNSQIMAIEMPDHKPLLVSGRSGPNVLTQYVEAFDWSTGAWTRIGKVFRAQWHCYAFRVGDDSIISVGGSTPDFQNVSPHSTWYQYSNGNSWAGPELLTGRYLYTGLIYNVDSACSHIQTLYVFGGADSNNTSLSSCEKLPLGLKSGPIARAYQHLAIRSGSLGQPVTMPLTEDIGDSAYLKSSWSNLTSLTATFSFDSSKLAFVALSSPAGWQIVSGSVIRSGNSVQFTMTNISSSPTLPLNMGDVRFSVKSTQPGMTLVMLSSLMLHIGQTDQEVCLSTSEDEMWGIEVIQQSSGVTGVAASNSIRIRPNPFEDHITIDDPSNTLTSVEILDVLGRPLQSETVHDASEARVATTTLQPGTYVVVCHARDRVQAYRITKSR